MLLYLAAIVVLAVVGSFLLIAVALSTRRDRRAQAQRVDRALGMRPIEGQRRRRWLGPSSGRAVTDRLRPLFTLGIRRNWGVTITTTRLSVIGLGSAAAVWLVFHTALHLPIWIATLVGLGGFLLIPRMFVKHQQSRIEASFTELFPDSIDMIVRMVRAGLPVAAAIRGVAEHGIAPVSTAFVQIADQTDIGIPLEAALGNIGERIGVPDFRFFATAVALQRSTGGNLAATLSMLSEIIRKRRSIRMKAKAATAEVRVSAIVLGAIPFFIVGALCLVAPAYLRPMIDDPRGNILVGVALLSLTLGGLTMRWMIRKSMRV